MDSLACVAELAVGFSFTRGDAGGHECVPLRFRREKHKKIMADGNMVDTNLPRELGLSSSLKGGTENLLLLTLPHHHPPGVSVEGRSSVTNVSWRLEKEGAKLRLTDV